MSCENTVNVLHMNVNWKRKFIPVGLVDMDIDDNANLLSYKL